MKKIYITFLLSLLPLLLFSQGENDNWYFGNYAALNFQTATPVGISTSNMYALEACGTVSDSNGKLLFYMNGEKIWNRQNQLMPNGTLIAPFQNDTAQQLAIVKNPANSNQYYVFTTGENNSNNPAFRINYSIVDMTLGAIGTNGSPLGDVVQSSKNTAVLDNLGNIFMSEAVTIVPNTSDNSFWVLIPNGNSLYSYKLSSTGFNNGNPVISNLNLPFSLNHKYYGIKASPKLNNSNYSHYVCISFWLDGLNPSLPDASYFNRLYSFNSDTGQITNNYSLQVNALRAYVPEFNKNATVLFLGYKNIHAVDLVNSTSSGVQSMELYHDSSTSGLYEMGIQRNKHGDIYISKPNSPYLAKVINPDSYGSGMSVNLTAVGLVSGGTQYGLPQLVPTLEQSGGYYPCIDNLVLTSESNLSFYYEIGNKITTKDKYVIGPRYNITMQAGSSVNLLPGTHIQAGAIYKAFIAPCRKKDDVESKQNSQVGMVLDLDKEDRDQALLTKNIDVYPNPVSDFLNVKSALKIERFSVFDISGKNINVKMNENRIDVRTLPAGAYIINIETKDGKTTKKFIKK